MSKNSKPLGRQKRPLSSKESDYLVELGKNIKRIRIMQGLTQTQLADKLQTEHRAIGRLEKGLVSVTITTLNRLSKHLKVPLSQILELGD